MRFCLLIRSLQSNVLTDKKTLKKNNKTRLPKRVVSAVLMTDRVQRSKQTEGNTDLGKFDR